MFIDCEGMKVAKTGQNEKGKKFYFQETLPGYLPFPLNHMRDNFLFLTFIVNLKIFITMHYCL